MPCWQAAGDVATNPDFPDEPMKALYRCFDSMTEDDVESSGCKLNVRMEGNVCRAELLLGGLTACLLSRGWWHA